MGQRHLEILSLIVCVFALFVLHAEAFTRDFQEAKVEVCHYNRGARTFTLVEVSKSSWLNIHKGHVGDCCVAASSPICTTPNTCEEKKLIRNLKKKSCVCALGWEFSVATLGCKACPTLGPYFIAFFGHVLPNLSETGVLKLQNALHAFFGLSVDYASSNIMVSLAGIEEYPGGTATRRRLQQSCDNPYGLKECVEYIKVEMPGYDKIQDPSVLVSKPDAAQNLATELVRVNCVNVTDATGVSVAVFNSSVNTVDKARLVIDIVPRVLILEMDPCNKPITNPACTKANSQCVAVDWEHFDCICRCDIGWFNKTGVSDPTVCTGVGFAESYTISTVAELPDGAFGLAFDCTNGDLYMADRHGGAPDPAGSEYGQIKKWNPADYSGLGTGFQPIEATPSLMFPNGITIFKGNLYVVELGPNSASPGTPDIFENGSVRKVDKSGHTSTLVTGLHKAMGTVAFDEAGNMYFGNLNITAGGFSGVRRLNLANGRIDNIYAIVCDEYHLKYRTSTVEGPGGWLMLSCATTVAGASGIYTFLPEDPTTVIYGSPFLGSGGVAGGFAVASGGSVVLVNQAQHCIVGPDGTAIAGQCGQQGYSTVDEGSAATLTKLTWPWDIVLDAEGALYFTEASVDGLAIGTPRLRKLTPVAR